MCTLLLVVSLRRAVVFPLISLLMLLIGLIMCLLGHVNTRRLRPKHQLLILVSGVVYITAGPTRTPIYLMTTSEYFRTEFSRNIKLETVFNNQPRATLSLRQEAHQLVGAKLHAAFRNLKTAATDVYASKCNRVSYSTQIQPGATILFSNGSRPE